MHANIRYLSQNSNSRIKMVVLAGSQDVSAALEHETLRLGLNDTVPRMLILCVIPVVVT